MDSNFNFKLLGLAILLTACGQIAVWFQHNWQFVNPKYKPEWWGWYLMAIPITWFFLKGTQFGVEAFDGKVWPNRFVGFILGIGSYVYLTNHFLNEPVTWKIGAQLILCFGIIVIQVFWK
jgi:hypothetical protein